MIRFYQLCISPLFGPRCRFYPSCSEYFKIALDRYSFFKAVWMGLKRIGKCHPWHEGGFDPL